LADGRGRVLRKSYAVGLGGGDRIMDWKGHGRDMEGTWKGRGSMHERKGRGVVVVVGDVDAGENG
jgi:hypothetical protein